MRYVALLCFLILVACSAETKPVVEQEPEQVEAAPEVQTVPELKISSPAFEHNGKIPAEYTCDGDDINPPLKIENIPEGTKSLVLIVDDPDAPMGTWNHWIVWNIPPTDTIGEDSIPGAEGMNDFKRQSYGGPCPPSGTHRYFFKLYALDTELDLSTNSKKQDVERAMEGHALAHTELIGLYSRQ